MAIKDTTLDWLGRRLGDRYVVESLLGSGPLGNVYLAREEDSGGKVAAKIPHPRFLETPAARERFRAELQGLIGLAHPHLVAVRYVGMMGSSPFVVTRYMPRGSLEGRFATRGGRMQPLEVLEWLPGIASALDFIHRQGGVHRDVRPGNILFDAQENVQLADLGMIHGLGDVETGLTSWGERLGSPDYMPPESQGVKYGPASDQYSLAAVVYRALGGSLTRLARLSGEPFGAAIESELEGKVPTRAAQAIVRALSAEPRERFATCTDFAKAFERGLQRVGPASAFASSLRGASPFPPTRAVVAVAAPVQESGLLEVALIALVIAIGAWGGGPRGAVRDASGAPQIGLRGTPGPPGLAALPTRPPSAAPPGLSPAESPAATVALPSPEARPTQDQAADVAGEPAAGPSPTLVQTQPPPSLVPPDPLQAAAELAREGKLSEAAEAFSNLAAGQTERFTVQVTANARDETARAAFDKAGLGTTVLIFENKARRRYYLCVGLHDTEAEAREALGSLPLFFTGQEPTIRTLEQVLAP